MNRILGQADSNRITHSVSQQGTNTDRALDATVFAVTGFGYPKVDGVIPVLTLFIKSSHQEAIGLDHDLRVARLHRENEVVIIVLSGNPGKLERAFNHAERRIAEPVHDPVTKRTVVGPDPHADAALLRFKNERRELLVDTLQLGGVFLIGVFDDGKLLLVRVVAGIHPNFFDPLHRLHGGVGLEVDIRDHRNVCVVPSNAGENIF